MGPGGRSYLGRVHFRVFFREKIKAFVHVSCRQLVGSSDHRRDILGLVEGDFFSLYPGKSLQTTI